MQVDILSQPSVCTIFLTLYNDSRFVIVLQFHSHPVFNVYSRNSVVINVCYKNHVYL